MSHDSDTFDAKGLASRYSSKIKAHSVHVMVGLPSSGLRSYPYTVAYYFLVYMYEMVIVIGPPTAPYLGSGDGR